MLYFSNMEAAGLIPEFLSEHDPRTVQEQLDENYAHGGGWNSFEGFTLEGDSDHYVLSYPGDPVYHEVSRAEFRNQTLVLFQYAWLAIIEDGKLLDVARVD